MLTLDSAGTRLATSVRVDVSSSVVRLALCYVARDAGLLLCQDITGACRCIVVHDRLPLGSGSIDVLVVQDSPAGCQEALAATLDGRVRSVVLWNEPDGLALACHGFGTGQAVIPNRVLELAACAPRMTDRQRETLRLLAQGRSSARIASILHQSESTAKRDIAELLELFDVPNRTALVAYAASLGFVTPAPGVVTFSCSTSPTSGPPHVTRGVDSGSTP